MTQTTQRPVPDQPDDRYWGHRIHPASSLDTRMGTCVGRDQELELLRVCLGFDREWRVARDRRLHDSACQRVRLEGAAGTGKRVLAREVARRALLPFYEVQGHAGMSPEDLVLAIVPRDTRPGNRGTPLSLQASPLATALMWGGVVYFDALHRASNNALAPLASLLDGRSTLYSGLTGLHLTRRPDAAPFFFLCSWDPSEGHQLPAFLEQRTLPKVTLKPLAPPVLRLLVGSLSARQPGDLLEAGREQKQSRLHGAIAHDVEILRAMTRFAAFRHALERFKGGELLDALRQLTGATAALPQQRAALHALQDLIKQRLRRRAFELATTNRAAENAEASRIYLALFAAGASERHDRNNLAHCLLHEGKLMEAQEQIRQELREPAPYAVAWLTHGEIAEALGHRATAKESYENAARLEPEPLPDGSTTRSVADAYLERLGQQEERNT